MMSTALIIQKVPKAFWKKSAGDNAGLASFVEDALAIERRIQKGVNLVNERKRYRLCVERIQKEADRVGLAEKTLTVSGEYLDILLSMYRKMPEEALRTRAMAGFFPPSTVEAHIDAFKKLAHKADVLGNEIIQQRLDFFKTALDEEHGIVERNNYWQGHGAAETEYEYSQVTPAPESPVTSLELSDLLNPKLQTGLKNVLGAKIQAALDSGGEVNFSNQPHSIIAEVLNEFAYKDTPAQPETAIRVIYMDGSEAETFPLRCLDEKIDGISDDYPPPIKVSLVSMRHLEMDEEVDMAWFRNRKVSSAMSFSETDAYCTQRTIELLAPYKGRPLHLHLYQTGLETAVVGFYRGLVRVLISRRKDPGSPPIRVVPHYFDAANGEYRAGKVWI